MSYSDLLPLMKRKGCTLTPEQFQERVNIVFHDHESLTYDDLHLDLRNSLQEQIDLLISDLFQDRDSIPEKIKMLDVGCGTGLSTEYIMNSQLKPNIQHITMLDSSAKMLEKAKTKATAWKKPTEFVQGYIPDLEEKFELIVICSVLHHIPDLGQFLAQVDQKLKPNGILLHLQDPNADFLGDITYGQRLKSFEKKHHRTSRSLTALIPKVVRRYINRRRGRKDYIDHINDQLLKEKVISRRMTADELWSVTDIHVPTKNDSAVKGISMRYLKKELKNFRLINQRSYGFFGKLKHDLHGEFKQQEERFIAENQLNGRNISAIWIKKS